MNISSHTEDARFIELLRKWHSGDFTRADEEEMNALAKNDPFRREALEGFFEHPEENHGSRIDSLRERIVGKKTGRRITLPQIWALAAALVLIFGAIWFFNIRPLPQQEGQVVQNIPPPPAEVQEQPGFNSSPVTDNMKGKAGATRQTNAPESASGIREPMPSAPAKDLAQADERATKIEAQSEQSEDFADAEQKQDKAYNSPSGIMRQQSTNMARPEEVAKESADRARKKRESAKPAVGYDSIAAAKPGAGKTLGSASAPSIGWTEFRRYLNANAHLTPAARANNISGTVRLKFRLNDSGQPVDFQIVKSLGYGCDEEAIRLVSSVAWIRNDAQSVAVDIEFVR